MTTTALIVAAGRGTRLPGAVPKPYRLLAGMPVLGHAIRRLHGHPAIDRVRVVIHPDDRVHYDGAADGIALAAPVEGGATRQQSVHAGLEALADDPPERVLVHDGARPLISADVIGGVVDALARSTAAIAAVPLADTIKRDDDAGRIAATVDRTGLWRAQTPQGFHYAPILDAHRAAAGRDLSDDAAVAEAAGLDVALVTGAADNLKITTEADLAHAERLLGAIAETRVGTGHDVHRFGPGDHVMLCGLAVPHTRGLIGHSDADVALHALTDALLGACGAGDIGAHFPSGDARWADADSAGFVAAACQLLGARGGSVVNADITLICQEPRIAGHRAAMCARVAALLGIADDRVNVKATTTEGLGFIGRAEGIAAQATVAARFVAGPADADAS